MKKVKVIQKDVYRDGGTIVYEDVKGNRYYMWNGTRIVYSNYPKCSTITNEPKNQVDVLDIELQVVKSF
jgi:hypothetical protein